MKQTFDRLFASANLPALLKPSLERLHVERLCRIGSIHKHDLIDRDAFALEASDQGAILLRQGIDRRRDSRCLWGSALHLQCADNGLNDLRELGLVELCHDGGPFGWRGKARKPSPRPRRGSVSCPLPKVSPQQPPDMRARES